MARDRWRLVGAAALLTLSVAQVTSTAWAAPGDDPPANGRDEDEMFGDGPAPPAGPAAPAKPVAPKTPAPTTRPTSPAAATPSAAGAEAEDADAERMRPAVWEDAAQDRLQIGGLIYLRHGLNFDDVDPLLDQSLTVSNLMDVYFDARPNDRVRAFARGRLLWTPTAVEAASASLLGLAAGASELSPQLVELWLKFDVARRVFASIGAQQVRFGATRLWNPVDFIYPNRRNPVTLFDQRIGLPMLKLHMPIESLGWNAYVLALADGATSLRGVAWVGRVEAVVGTAEVGLMARKRLGEDLQLGLDASAGVWEVDLGAELGLRRDARGDWHWMLSGKLEHSISYGDDDSIIWGGEVFYQPEGIASLDGELDVMEDYAKRSAAAALAGTPAPAFPLTFFYTGRWYAGLFAVAMGPGSWNDTSVTFSAVANLSDRSGILRLDVGHTLHQHLRLELYGNVNVGSDGEFRFYTGGLRDRLGPLVKAAGQDPDALFQRPIGAVGLNLRVTL